MKGKMIKMQNNYQLVTILKDNESFPDDSLDILSEMHTSGPVSAGFIHSRIQSLMEYRNGITDCEFNSSSIDHICHSITNSMVFEFKDCIIKHCLSINKVLNAIIGNGNYNILLDDQFSEIDQLLDKSYNRIFWLGPYLTRDIDIDYLEIELLGRCSVLFEEIFYKISAIVNKIKAIELNCENVGKISEINRVLNVESAKMVQELFHIVSLYVPSYYKVKEIV